VNGLGLRASLFLARAGWPALAGLLMLCAGAAAFAWWLPGEQKRLERSEAEYRRLLTAVRAPAAALPRHDPDSVLAERYAAFNAALTPRADVPQLLKTVFGEAAKAGLTLSQAEYRLSETRNGIYVTYQMILPVKGPYLKLREFIDSVLVAAPAAALEEVSFKRDSIGSAAAEARLRLVFYLKDMGV